MNIACTAKNDMVRVLLAIVATVLLTIVPTRMTFAASTTTTCKPIEVATYAERIHVRCAQATSAGIVFFSVATANSAHAARMLSSLLMAHTVGKNVVVEFDPNDTSGTAFGCQAHDCRRLLSVAVQ